MVNNLALIIVMSLALGGVITLLLMFCALRKQTREIALSLIGIIDILKKQSDSFKLFVDLEAKNEEALQRIINRQEYRIALSKYILAETLFLLLASRLQPISVHQPSFTGNHINSLQYK